MKFVQRVKLFASLNIFAKCVPFENHPRYASDDAPDNGDRIVHDSENAFAIRITTVNYISTLMNYLTRNRGMNEPVNNTSVPNRRKLALSREIISREYFMQKKSVARAFRRIGNPFAKYAATMESGMFRARARTRDCDSLFRCKWIIMRDVHTSKREQTNGLLWMGRWVKRIQK